MTEQVTWGRGVERRTDGAVPFLVYEPRLRSVSELFDAGRRWHGREHLVLGGRRLSFDGTATAAESVAAQMRANGLQPGDRVLLLGANSLAWVVSFWGTVLAGGVVVLANSLWTREEVGYACEVTEPVLVVVAPELADRVPAGVTTLPLRLPQIAEAVAPRSRPTAPSYPRHEDDPAVIIFTSGSTGRPKGAVLSHRACIAMQHALLHRTNRLPDQLPADFRRDVNLQTGPLFHIGGVQGLLRAWLLGATMVLTSGRFDATEILRLIEAERVCRWGAVPTMVTRVLDAPHVAGQDLSTLRSLTVGGSVVPPELLDRIPARFPNAVSGISQIYGLSEAGGTLTMASPHDLAQRQGTVGRALDVVELAVADADADGIGEIVARSPAQMSGYWGDPSDLTIDSTGWLHTGDLGRMDDDGFLYITGRAKDVIIRGGENVAAPAVERVLARCEAVQDVAVVGLPHADLGETVAAVIVVRPGAAPPDEADLDAFAREHLAYFEVPALWWVRTEPMPVTASGKVDKPTLVRDFPPLPAADVPDVPAVPAMAAMAEATLDEEMLDRMRALAGTQLRIDHSINNEEVTRLAVERFADAIGDPNQLWRDRDYAETSAFARRVAPPSFVMGCFSGIQFGWPGLGSFHSGSDLTLHRPLFVGDVVTASCRYVGFDGPRSSSFASVVVTDEFYNAYHNQHGELVAEIRWWVMNYMRQQARSTSEGRVLDVPHRWTLAEVEAIEADVLAEADRAADPRWWDDVAVGDLLDVVTKGPVGLTDEVAYVASGGPPIPRVAANGVALRQYQRHPAWAFRDPDTMALEPIYAVHYNRAAAQAMGVALQYDVGFQRQCWHVQLLTHWMGDSAWVRRAAAQYRSFVYHADVVRLGGEVTRKYVADDGEHVVDVVTWARNQRGQDVMPGSATIGLPARGKASPVESRIP